MKEKNSKNPYNRENETPRYRTSGFKDGIPGINTPGIELPEYNPPVPNRAWTAMRKGLDIEDYEDDIQDGNPIVSGINENGDIDI